MWNAPTSFGGSFYLPNHFPYAGKERHENSTSLRTPVANLQVARETAPSASCGSLHFLCPMIHDWRAGACRVPVQGGNTIHEPPLLRKYWSPQQGSEAWQDDGRSAKRSGSQETTAFSFLESSETKDTNEACLMGRC